MLKQELGMGYGDANTLTSFYLKSIAEPDSSNKSDDALGDIYTGAKADLRPIYEKLISELKKFGPFEIAPKKT